MQILLLGFIKKNHPTGLYLTSISILINLVINFNIQHKLEII